MSAKPEMWESTKSTPGISIRSYLNAVIYLGGRFHDKNRQKNSHNNWSPLEFSDVFRVRWTNLIGEWGPVRSNHTEHRKF